MFIRFSRLRLLLTGRPLKAGIAKLTFTEKFATIVVKPILLNNRKYSTHLGALDMPKQTPNDEKSTRPKLTKNIKVSDFNDFYWLKEELVPFCKLHGISTEGRKPDIQKRIVTFLETGKVIGSSTKATKSRDSDKPLTLDTPVVTFKSDDKTRKFFTKQIGDHFHFTSHMNRFRENETAAEKELTYRDLVNEWNLEYTKRKDPNYKPEILDSCEYNKFMRAYRADKKKQNIKSTHADIVTAWNKVKTKRGPRVYVPDSAAGAAAASSSHQQQASTQNRLRGKKNKPDVEVESLHNENASQNVDEKGDKVNAFVNKKIHLTHFKPVAAAAAAAANTLSENAHSKIVRAGK